MWSRGILPIRYAVSSSKNAFSAAAANKVGIDEFLNSISKPTVKHQEKPSSGIESAAEFSKWINKNKLNSVSNFICAAEIAINIKEADQNAVFQKLSNVSMEKLELDFLTTPIEVLMNLLRFLVQISPSNNMSKDLQEFLIEKKHVKAIDLKDVPFETLLKIVRYADNSMDALLFDQICKAVQARIEADLDKPSDLLILLAGPSASRASWFHCMPFVKKVDSMIPFMNISEKVSIVKYMAAQKQRNKQLLGALGNSITQYDQCLSIKQIINIVSSYSTLSFLQPRLLARVSDDLLRNANVLDNWSDVLSITDAFARMRLGSEKTLDLMVKWAIHHAKEAATDELSRFVSAMARLNVKSAKPLAKELKPRLQKTRVRSANVWLNTIYSLAFFEELEPALADSVLNKSFIEQLFSSTHEMHDRVRKALILLRINECAKIDIDKYKGPTIDKATFEPYGIKFDAQTVLQARQLKYSKNSTNCDDVFLQNLFKIAPKETHCMPSGIEECGAFVDAYVVPDKETGRVFNISQWENKKPTPIMFFEWAQTLQNTELTGERALIGSEALSIRLLRSCGSDPVIIFNKDFEYCGSEVEKLKMLREKIHKTVETK